MDAFQRAILENQLVLLKIQLAGFYSQLQGNPALQKELRERIMMTETLLSVA